jgi:hypothetical protein
MIDNIYKVRAKRIDNDKWITGQLVSTYDNNNNNNKPISYILCGMSCVEKFGLHSYQVDPNTICRSTNLKDMNGVCAFANDVFKDEQGRIFVIEEVEGGMVCYNIDYKDDGNRCLVSNEMANIQMQEFFSKQCTVICNVNEYVKSN